MKVPGAIAIYAHLVSPLATGLFQHAIIQSGAPADITLEKAEEIGVGVAEKVGCPGDATPEAAACLRAVPVDKLLANQVTPIAAYIDGKLLPAPIEKLLDEGKFNAVPLMNGTNHDEGNLIAAFMFDLSGAPLKKEDFRKAIGIIGGFIPRVGYPPASYGAVAAIYDPDKYDAPGLAAAQIITDGVIACPALKSSRTIAAHGVPVYEYEMAGHERTVDRRRARSASRIGRGTSASSNTCSTCPRSRSPGRRRCPTLRRPSAARCGPIGPHSPATATRTRRLARVEAAFVGVRRSGAVAQYAAVARRQRLSPAFHQCDTWEGLARM